MGSHAGEVLIVGGGLIGSSIAWRLAQRGIRVRIADAGGFAQTQSFPNGEASTAGAGMLSPGGEFTAPSPWVDLGIASMRLYPEFVEQLHSETGMDVDFRICGCLQLPSSPEATSVELQRQAGIRVELRDIGLFYPDDAIVDPVALLLSLRKAIVARGVVVETWRVTEIESNEYLAIVIASGAWSGALRVSSGGGVIALPESTPVKGHLIGYQMRPGLLGPYLRKGHTYIVQRSDGFMIAGSTEESVGFNTDVDAAICEDIHRRAVEMLPALGEVSPSKRWIGFRPGPESATGPHMQRMNDGEGNATNVWLAYGHYRNGILLTPLTATKIAGEIAASVAEAS
ncbi:MAG: FAD-dependent oxidoreductase [Acidobacteriota bacterium]